jgi:outer membrane protein assembly factor BamB
MSTQNGTQSTPPISDAFPAPTNVQPSKRAFGFTPRGVVRAFPVFLCLAAGAAFGAEPADWPQWGGPHRDFTVESSGLAESWPAGGPPRLWSRPLGEGYSGIAVEDGRLYTMYRERRRGVDREVVAALDAETGETLWEHAYAAAAHPRMSLEHGPGPHTTPLVLGPHVFTVGILARVHCLDKETGRVVWERDLMAEFNAPVQRRGYASSPIAYGNTIILPVGAPGRAFMAFRRDDGSVAWSGGDVTVSPSSPLIIEVDGQDQLVAFMADEIVGANPLGGEILWRRSHPAQFGLNISTPVWGEDNLLFCSSAYGGGSRLLRLTRSGRETAVAELWHTNRMRIHIGNAIRIGDRVIGSSGDFGPAFLAAIDLETGELAWQDRTFGKANLVRADDKLILLDEDGVLALVEITPTGPRVITQAEVLEHNAWTAPSLVGTRLYLRDRKQIMALDLGGAR